MGLLGLNPLSMIGKFVGGLLAILPYILVALLVVGSYFYGQHNGTIKCNAAQLQKVIDAKDIQLNWLKTQNQNQVIELDKLKIKNAALDNQTAITITKVKTVFKDIRVCDQGKDQIDLLNGVRNGN